MNQPVEIITLERGVRQSIRTLSGREEQRQAGYAASLGAGASAGGFFCFALLTWAGGFVLHAPLFFATAVAGVGAAAGWAWRRTFRRASEYRIGPQMENDAFATLSLELVRPRRGGGYELGLVYGMTGVIEQPGSLRPIEGLTRREAVVWEPIVPGQLARIELGQTTFMVRGLAGAEAYAALEAPRAPLSLPGLQAKAFIRNALAVTTAAALLPFSTAVAAPVHLSHADLASSIPTQASPWQVEKLVYRAVQVQADKLYACFESVPSQCLKSGYVGVGIKLAQTGDVKSHWITRTTYTEACPVSACVQEVISSLFFEELPESMTLVIPVQVLENPLAQRAPRVHVGGASGFVLDEGTQGAGSQATSVATVKR